ncbi:vacuolar protein sorting-associated protein [Achlya hypogyna]|uniref:Vacuolar protein sorting-associated protein n=1 Tax=Achlya hypogyna TaxID=1202772 RepID=A0A1V9YRX4_ACHHY|nr:vacuolar protein sorting-associated protein [Achlya hypogyna]
MAATTMDAIGAVRSYVEKIIMDGQLDGMKALLLDAETTKIISMVLSQSQILEKQVFLVEQLGAKGHEKMAHLKAAVLIRPTVRNLELLKTELKTPQYGEYHIFFTNITSSDLLDRLAEADEHEVVQQVHEYYADYLAINDNLFHFNLSGAVGLSSKSINLANMSPKTAAVYQRSVDGLLAVLLSMKKKPLIRFVKKSEIAEKLARDVATRMQHEDGLFDFRQPSVPPVLLILDRKDDPVTPLLSQWTYQAMVHELMGLFENRVDLERVPGVRDDMKQVVLSVTSDAFFAQHMHANFGEICMAVKGLVDTYKHSSKQNENIESIEDMQRFVDKYAEFRAQSVTVSKHVTLMGELNRLIEVQGLMDVSTLEQDMACNDDAAGHLRELALRLRKAAIAPANKLRLALLYALRYESPAAIKSVKELLLEAGVPSGEAVTAMLQYGGAAARAGDLFGDKGLKKFIKAMAQVTQGLQGVQCVLTQHVPPLIKTLDLLFKGALPDADFGAFQPATPLPKKLKDVVVYVTGGVTFEESLKVAELNAKLAPQGQRVLLGGPMIHNSESFLKELLESVETAAPGPPSWKYDGKHL